MALLNEDANVVPPRELPKLLKRGPLRGCLGAFIPLGGIQVCEIILGVLLLYLGVCLLQ